MGQGTKHDVMLPVRWFWAPLTIVWKFVVMESSSNERSPNPKWPQEILGNTTWKYSPRINFKLARWQRFVRIWRLSLQTTACLRQGWRRTFRRSYSRLSTRSVFYLLTQFLPPLPPPLSSSSAWPLLPSTSTISTSLFSFPSPFPRWKKSSGSPADEGSNTWEMMEARERGGCFIIVVEIKLNYVAQGSHPNNPAYGRHWLSWSVQIVQLKSTLFDPCFIF